MTLNRVFELIRRTLIPKGDVRERAVKSGIWITIINVFDRGLQFAKILVLARLLSPTAIGLIGIALLSLAVLEQFSRFGINQAIIQRKEEDINEYLNTAWSIQVARGVMIAGAAYAVAPYASVFFSEPRATDLVRVIAFSSLLTALQNPGAIYFRKNLEFHKEFAYTLTGSIVNAVVTIATAWIFQSVWAFVFGRIAGNLTMLILSYVIHPYRPWPEFDRTRAKELIDYGKWIFVSGILLFLITQGDDTFVGWFLSAGALGLYQLAYRLSNAPSTEITNVISNVTFPAYSKLQTDIEKLRKGYLRTVQLTTAVSFPMAVGIVAVAPSFVHAFLGEQWLAMIVPIQILAAEGAVRSLGASSGPLFQAVGRPDYGTKLQVLRLAIIAALIYPATSVWGISGTALVIVGSGLVVNPISIYLATGLVEEDFVSLLLLISYPIVASAAMGLGLWFVRGNMPIGLPLIEFFLLLVSGIMIYSLVMAGIEWRFRIGLRAIFRTIVGAVK